MGTSGRPIKPPSKNELEFARLMEEFKFGSIEAARKVYNVRCEPGTKEAQKYRDLARSKRITDIRKELRAKLALETQAQEIVTNSANDIDQLRSFARLRLREIRNDTGVKAATRFQAIKALEKLHNPAADVNLILKWIDYTWRFCKVHCPCCHKSFPLHEIKNEKLNEWRASQENLPKLAKPQTDYERRLAIIKMFDSRKTPHLSQKIALEAPERHILGTGAARAGKSWLLAVWATMGLMLPGVEVWIIARVYDEAASEIEYLKNFMKTMFHPHEDIIMRMYEDKQNGEIVIYTKWGSILKIRSSKSKGSITGRALEFALIAEPGWVPADIYEEVRARMSERLGRILAFGTPKGTGGFISRLVRATGRDPITKRMKRLPPQKRLISAGCPWNISLKFYKLNPRDNPVYVQSELGAARVELLDKEYASEFEGDITAESGKKFYNVTNKNLLSIPFGFFNKAHYVLGIDQGPTNFAAVLTAWDGNTAVPCYEYFDTEERTMKANLQHLMARVPLWIGALGGRVSNWTLTITDRAPLLVQIFSELDDEGKVWPTPITERYLNNRKMGDNWRKETQEWINNTAITYNTDPLSDLNGFARLMFHSSNIENAPEDESPGALMLLDQVMEVIEPQEAAGRESGKGDESKKGWIVRDPLRGDHVLDAWYFTMWTILSGQLVMPEGGPTIHEPYAEAQRGFETMLAIEERALIHGESVDRDAIFREKFNRERGSGSSFIPGAPGHYPDDS